MKILYTTPSKSEADALVGYLADAAIDAAAVARFDATIAANTRYDVILRTKDDFTRAQAAIESFLTFPAQLSEDLGDRAVADLSSLKPEMAPPCPACGTILPLDGELERCPACGEEVDVSALVVAKHGPEVLVAPQVGSKCPRCGLVIGDAGRDGAAPPTARLCVCSDHGNE